MPHENSQKPDLQNLTGAEKAAAENAVQEYRARVGEWSTKALQLAIQYQQLHDPNVVRQTREVVDQRLRTLRAMIKLEENIRHATP